ncbi:MAG: hypothetical protein MK078_09005 [Crocinitomicaceae bacterium]|nr:hypothetical protein [Crocinitomicaceae bacterium]
MKILALAIALIIGYLGQAQIHNRLLQLNTGITNEQFDFRNATTAINDTSQYKYEYVSWSPSISYTHEFALGSVLSMSGKVGFQYQNLFYNHTHYGGAFTYASFNPRITVFYRRGFEYYIKLAVGISIFMHKDDVIHKEHERYFPERVNFFTGVTLGGFNYFLSDHWGINAEFSIWSPEMLTFGVNYRFFRGIPQEPIDYENNEEGF